MKSMTGYGRGTASCKSGQVAVEISAVNSRKQVDLRFSIPKEFGVMDPALRRIIQSKLSRGSLYVVVSYQLAEEQGAGSYINIQAAKDACTQLRVLCRNEGFAEPTLQEVLLIPGVLCDGLSQRYDELKNCVEPALNDAINALDESRCQEGERLKADLLERGKRVADGVAAIEARESEAMTELAERLRQRIAKLGVELAQDDERLAKEMVFYADRADIAEEIVRLKSHVEKYYQLLNSNDDPGRELDFLGQEMNREITTLSAKTADLSISKYAMALKVEISKIREQVMNIE